MADRPTERRRLDQMTDDDLDALYAELEQYRNALNWQTSCLACARVMESGYAETVRAERAEQQLAEVRALAADMRNWCSPRGIAADYATRIEETLTRAAALDGAQQPGTPSARLNRQQRTKLLASLRPACPECDDTGACAGGPCAHPDASCDSHETSGDSHDDTQQPGPDGDDLPCRHGCRAAADELAQETQQDGHAGACGPLTAPGDPEPAETPTGRHATAQARATLTVTVRGATPHTAERRADGIRDLVQAEFPEDVEHTAVELEPDDQPLDYPDAAANAEAENAWRQGEDHL